MTVDELMEIEWRAWRELCDALRATGAVTQEDCESKANADPVTPGQKVFNAIQVWGNCLVEMRVAQAKQVA